MQGTLKSFSEHVAKANDLFCERYSTLDTIMGIMDKTLRKQGIEADAITIDCITINKKIVFVLHDIKPEFVDVALGNKEGTISNSSTHKLTDMHVEEIFLLMEKNFL